MSKIKYCVWDVGDVIYKYTLEPLNDYCAKETSDLPKFAERKGRFNYNEYMKGRTSWIDFCKELCSFYFLPYNEQRSLDIERILHLGIKYYFPETRKTQEYLVSVGVENCILSNALPVLANTSNCLDIIKDKNVFCSFDLGLLKPNIDIYEAVRNRLGCEFSEIIFVDDKEANTKAAAGLGINAVLFNNLTIETDIKLLLNVK